MGRTRLLLIAGLLGLMVAPLFGQPFSTPISQAIALLQTGVTTFSVVGLDSLGYINWGSARAASGYGLRDNDGVIESKNDGGDWSPLSTEGSAPSTAKYIIQTASASLPNAQALGALNSALLLNTTTTGVATAYTGTACTNQFVRSLSAIGAATCSSVSLSTDVTGTVTVPNGGTGAATLTGVVVGGGTATMTASTSSTAGQVLRVTGTNTFAFGALDLDDTDAVTGTLAVANGGTNLASGTSGGVLGYTASGTVASSVALTASALVLGGGAGATPTPLGSLGTTTTVLHGNAAGAPTFAAVNIATDTTGTLGVARGGTNIASYAIGDLIQATGATTLTALASPSAGSFLRSGGVTTASVWSTTKWTNSATTGDILFASGANQYANLADVAAGSFLRSGGVSTAPVWSTTAWPNSATTGDILTATSANTYANVAAVAVGRVLGSQGVATAPAWLTNVTATSFASLGTVASAGFLRLANTDAVLARNNADDGNVALLTSNSSNQVVLGGTNATALTFTDGTRSLFWRVAAAPTISSGFGTTPSIAGTPSAFKVTVGSGGDTTGVVLFNVTWGTAPVCVANNQTTAQLVRATPTTTQVTVAGTLGASDVLSVMCVGY